MKKNLKFIILALAIIAVITIWQTTVSQTKNKAKQTAKQETTQENIATPPAKIETAQTQTKIDITFTFATNDTKTVEYPILANSTKNLFAISQEIAKQQAWDWQYTDYGELGYLVTKINNTKNGQDNKYWQYYIDNEQPQISANKYIPKSGEKIEWRFTESKF
jgi:Domain of unknown function (DUF4430)